VRLSKEEKKTKETKEREQARLAQNREVGD